MATINGTAGADVLVGDDANQFGIGGDDTIHGGAGNDLIDGRGGVNAMFGDDGDDIFRLTTFSDPLAQGHSIIDGGSGFDTLDLSEADTSLGIRSNFVINLDASSFALLLVNAPTIDVKNVEQVILGSQGLIDFAEWTHDVKIVASAAGSYVMTGTDNDTFVGGEGRDLVYYNGGSDNVSLGGGEFNVLTVVAISGHADHVVATAGTGQSDNFSVERDALFHDPANIDLKAGACAIGATTFSLSGFENVAVEGSLHVSTVVGNDDANLIQYVNGSTPGGFIFSGGGGNDTILGGMSDDQIRGDTGDDVVSGGGGSNFVDGGNGDDYIEGGGHNTYSSDPVYAFERAATTRSWGARVTITYGAIGRGPSPGQLTARTRSMRATVLIM